MSTDLRDLAGRWEQGRGGQRGARVRPESEWCVTQENTRMRTTEDDASERTEALVETQDRIDEAQGVKPLVGIKRLVVGGWLALAAHYFMIGGVPLEGVEPALLGLMALAGWACVISGGAKFVASRRKLRRLKKQYSEQLTSGAESSERPSPAEVLRSRNTS